MGIVERRPPPEHRSLNVSVHAETCEFGQSRRGARGVDSEKSHRGPLGSSSLRQPVEGHQRAGRSATTQNRERPAGTPSSRGASAGRSGNGETSRESTRRRTASRAILRPNQTAMSGIQVNGATSNGGSQPPRNRIAVKRAHQDHVRVFADEEEGERHGRVLHLVAGDELGLRLGQVERMAVRLRQGRHEEDHEHREQRDEEPETVRLRLGRSSRDVQRAHARAAQ